jgi:outer membrane protein OmpA-like peptidoglycan-associated protein
MATRIKTLPRVLLAVGVFGGLLAAGNCAVKNGWIPMPGGDEAVVPKAADLPEMKESTGDSRVAQVDLPGDKPAKPSGPEIRYATIPWNSQIGLMFSNGGPSTTEGSLQAKHGVSLVLRREDMYDKMQAELVAFATALQKEPQPKAGTHFVNIMGDGAAAFLAGLNPQLEKLGPEYRAEIVGSAGFSRGEDKFMGPAEWKQSPKTSRGGLIAGVLRDGDWNIAMKWAGDNGIKNNPDETTWDPDALNWVGTPGFVEAGEKYISGACEDRPVVSGGKRTGETKKVCVQAVVTWTPGDVTVAKSKGGLVNIVSTKEYRSQMPAAIIGIRKWNSANKERVVGMLTAMHEGGDQVKVSPAALRRGADISAKVYGEEDGAYWERYFKGVVEADKTGAQIHLGGSSVNNLTDAQELFGLAPGSANVFAATYTVFGDVVVQQYPKLVPSYPPVGDVLNLDYVRSITSKKASSAPAAAPRFKEGQSIETVVSKRNWSINFQTGSASFTPDAQKQLEELKNGLLVAGDLAVEVHGHTDNTGDPGMNLELSARRANAVRDWLMKQSTSEFPSDRFTVVRHGGQKPIATNASEDGRSKNRRVEIILGTVN